MASVCFMCFCEPHKRRRVHINLSVLMAHDRLRTCASDWAGSERGRAAIPSKRSGIEYELLNSVGQLHGSLWIDDIEPPERHESRVWDCRLKRGPPKQPA